MEPKSSSGTRKRSRPLHQKLNSSSPLSGASPLSSSKRRKLDLNASSTPTPNTLRALKSVIGGVFGFGRTKENDTSDKISDLASLSKKNLNRTEHDANEPDELSSPGNLDDERTVRKQRMTNRKAQSTESSMQVDDKTQTPPSRSEQRRVRLSNIAKEAQSAEDELSAPSEPPTELNRTDVGDGFLSIGSHAKRKLKRPSKTLNAEIARTSVIGVTRESSLEEDSLPGSAARSSGRERRRPRRYSNEILDDLKSQPKGILTPSKKLQDRPKKFVTFGGEVQSISRSPSEAFQESSIFDDPVGTPTVPKRKRGRPKKLIALEPPVIPVSVDLNASTDKKAMIENGKRRVSEIKTEATPAKKLKRPKHTSEPVQITTPEGLVESDVDDTICVICRGGDSEEPNEIVLCDNCDLAAHQQCYGVPLIPEGDWLCRDCRPDEEEELSLLEIGSVSEPILDLGGSNVPNIEGFEFHLQVMQKLLLDKLTGRRRLRLYGLDEEYRKVHQVVEQTVLAGEGNSIFIIGARGSGKSTLVESVIANLSDDHRENFHVVRLNGFIHTDDKLALREIWRQLGREMDVDDSLTSKTNNYADTLTSLLALLSHPSEILEVETNQTAKSVIFVLDEFDLFTSHPRQTLLYNLFDIAQARKAPIAVLGVTTKIDVAERLEKRVKSRFSHRYVHLPLPRSLAAYWEICKQGLLIDMDELVEEGFDPGVAGVDEFQLFWESMINNLYGMDALFKHHLQTYFYRSKSVTAFLTSCILPIANLSPNGIPLTGASFTSTFLTFSPPDSKLHLLQSLADLDLALLIAAARLNVILDADSCNFAMAYDEYSSLTSKHKIQTSSSGVAALGAGTKVWGREVAINSWERLIDCELLIPAGTGGTSTSGRDVSREVKMWKVDIALEEIPGSVEGLSAIMNKWCREI